MVLVPSVVTASKHSTAPSSLALVLNVRRPLRAFFLAIRVTYDGSERSINRELMKSSKLLQRNIRKLPCGLTFAMCLVLNRAALVAVLEYFDGHKGRHSR